MRRTALLLILLLALLQLTGCENDATAPETIILSADKDFVPDPGFYDLIDTLEYESFEGWIYPGQGGIMQVQSATWPGTCYFGIHVPPAALPAGLPSTRFSLSFPTYAEYQRHADLPLILRLEPEGINFQAPITVMATWMPWVPGVPEEFFNIEEDSIDEYGVPSIMKTKGGYRVFIDVMHFSDWGVQGGGGGG